jgi:hypothetical protein
MAVQRHQHDKAAKSRSTNPFHERLECVSDLVFAAIHADAILP